MINILKPMLIDKTHKHVYITFLFIFIALHADNIMASNNKKYISSSITKLTFNPKNEKQWIRVGGALSFDQRGFVGNNMDKGSEFYNGANFRSCEINLIGGLGKRFFYSFTTNYETKTKRVNTNEAYLIYSINENFGILVGQVFPGFSLEGLTSYKWQPFLEKSMPTNALGTGLGLGANLVKWNKNYTFIAAAMQPKQGAEAKDLNGSDLHRNDRWQTSARFVYRPIYKDKKILQLGASGYFQDDCGAAKRYTTHTEATSKNHINIIDTGYTKMSASNHKGIDLEMAIQSGSLYGEIEYQRSFITRPAGKEKLQFYGYHILTSYVLTGESKTFNDYNGTFGQVFPSSKNGAWEMAFRYSFLNLNNKDIFGGKGNNISLALIYYLNNNIKIACEYIRSILHPSNEALKDSFSNTNKRKLHILGLRLQAVM